MIKTVTATFLILLLSGINFSFAGQLDTGLAEKMTRMEADDPVRVVIALEGPSAHGLKASLAQNYATTAARHRAGMAELKSAAARSQSSLLDNLYALERAGRAANIKSHWIINVIEVDLAVSEIEWIAARGDVERISELPEIKLIEPEDVSVDFSAKTNLEPWVYRNITLVGADSAWALGFDGNGRIICSFDTGVEGIHPALYRSWKGHDGDTSAAWFDPVGGEPFPTDTKLHGTKTMGIMVGYDSLQELYYGVAPGAEWISAAVVDIIGASFIDAFEWAADPDGNPNTISDVPDVINHSWGIAGIGCNDYFWEMIDNTEALGIVNIFAAGNSGPDSMSLTNPANRAFDSLDCFAVGMISMTDSLIDKLSSRGPSDCDSISIKPNCVAPGHDFISTAGSFGVDGCYGTSFSAPHVSGAVAILRQYAPDATVDEIKEAILAGCRAMPDSISEPNNTYGWGLLYIPAALEALSPDPAPDLKVYSFEHQLIAPGDTARGSVVITNLGDDIDSAYGRVTGSNGGLQILTDSIHFGTVALNGIDTGNILFEAVVDDTITPGQMLTVHFGLYGAGDFYCPCKLYIRVGESPPHGFFTHITDSLRFTVSNFGQYGFAAGSMFPLGYSGFRYGDMLRNDLFEGAFMIGIDADHVSDGVKNLVEEPDNDFAVAPGGNLAVSIPGTDADRETFSIYNDGRAEKPFGIEIYQRTFSWNNYPHAGFVILEYAIKNISDSTLNNLYAGLYLDWTLANNWYDLGDYFLDEQLGYIYDPSETKYRGAAVLNPEGMTSHKLFRDMLNDPITTKDLDLDESEKFEALTYGDYDASSETWFDLSQVVATGPFTLAPQGVDTVTLVVVGGKNLGDLITNAATARNMYSTTTDVTEPIAEILPTTFSLYQNYPNPFNPSTIISFSLQRKARVDLEVYNLLGEKVVELLDETLPVGWHQITWDGRDGAGREVATGVYFYRLRADGFSQTRKMIMLK